jgi:vacuole morphology and inheritance protein 14
VDKLVQLLESPVFVLLRLQLLDAAQPFQPALLKSLYGMTALFIGGLAQSPIICYVCM